MLKVLRENEHMPDWHQSAADEIDRIDWQAIAELDKAREVAPRAALAEEVSEDRTLALFMPHLTQSVVEDRVISDLNLSLT